MNYRMLTLAAIMCATALPASARNYCGGLSGKEWDYRETNEMSMNLVNGRHFTEEVELGIRGTSGSLGDIGADYHYTLSVMPNHARALNALIRLAPRYPSGMVPGAKYPIECYFERAVRIFPDDGTAWLMYARYQYMKGRNDQALSMLEKALEKSPEDPAINYNMGLVYAKQKKYEQALPYAQKAYALNFPMPALKQMLVKAGKWVEPPPAPEAAAEQPAASASAPASSAPASAAIPAASKPADPAASTKP